MPDSIPGARPPTTWELIRAQDRWTFLYVEHARVSRDANALTITDERGTTHVPAAAIGAILLGPGTMITHQGITVLAECGSTCVWVGELGVRYYAHGRSLAASTRLLERQAELVTNQRSRLDVARRMYQMRFAGENVERMTMQQLRGREGARVRRTYREHSQRTGVVWKSRDYNPADFADSDGVNQVLSAATTALYGVVHAVIVSLGCSPGLGFIHTGHDRSFVFDVADLYKADLAIPVAFDVAAANPMDIPAATRRLMRDRMFEAHLLERAVKDVRSLLDPTADPADQDLDNVNVNVLWDDRSPTAVAGGVNYAELDW